MRNLLNDTTLSVLTFILFVLPTAAISGDRLLGTGGVNQIEGSGGGGLTPWALISGYGTDQQIGVSAFYTHAHTRGDFTLNTIGIAAGLYNHVELSASQSRFGLGTTVPGATIHLNTLGAKVRLIGDAIYDQDQWLPQISAGMQYKYNEDYHFIPKALGAMHSSGIDYYLAASKLFLGALQGYNLLLNADLRATKANQFGILGFGGDKNDHYHLYPEASAAVMLTDNWLIGSEIRYKPNNLSVYKENKAYDVFMTWFPVRNISLTGAYIDLGNIADKNHQNGWYLSGQFTY